MFCVTKVTDTCLIKTTKHSNLETLVIMHSVDITDTSLVEIATCKNLKKLELRCCENITCKGMAKIANLINLQSLCITCCEKVGNKSLIEIGTHCSNLKSIEIGEQKLVSDEGMIQISKNCNLETVDINRCDKIGDRTLIEICRNSSNLHTLRIYFCDLVIDATLNATSRCKNLRSLFIQKCIGISDAGVMEIINHCNNSRLHSLDIRDCDNITSIGYDAIRLFQTSNN